MPAASRPGGRSRASPVRPPGRHRRARPSCHPTDHQEQSIDQGLRQAPQDARRPVPSNPQRQASQTIRADITPGAIPGRPWRPRTNPGQYPGQPAGRSRGGAVVMPPPRLPQSTWGGREWEGDATFSGIVRSYGTLARVRAAHAGHPGGSGANLGTITPHMPHRNHWSLPAMGGTGVVCPCPRLAGVVCPSPHNPAGMAVVTIQKYATEPPGRGNPPDR
jgi:hypothetical protein